MNMLDSEPMKIERVRDVIEKASNSKIKSRKKKISEHHYYLRQNLRLTVIDFCTEELD